MSIWCTANNSQKAQGTSAFWAYSPLPRRWASSSALKSTKWMVRLGRLSTLSFLIARAAAKTPAMPLASSVPLSPSAVYPRLVSTLSSPSPAWIQPSPNNQILALAVPVRTVRILTSCVGAVHEPLSFTGMRSGTPSTSAHTRDAGTLRRARMPPASRRLHLGRLQPGFWPVRRGLCRLLSSG